MISTNNAMHLDCQGITYRYPASGAPVFKNLSFSIDSPGFHALFGPSGVGKTTLARMIAGSINGYEGKINHPDNSKLLYSYNLERLPGWATVWEHLLEITPSSRKSTLKALIDAFGLKDCLESRFSQLSLGQQNRTNLTRYLIQDFDLMVMDESLANVDEATREKIILKVKDMFADRAFLYISHNMVEVATFCKNILILRDTLKIPQIKLIMGQDRRMDNPLDQNALEKTLLEIVHAS